MRHIHEILIIIGLQDVGIRQRPQLRLIPHFKPLLAARHVRCLDPVPPIVSFERRLRPPLPQSLHVFRGNQLLLVLLLLILVILRPLQHLAQLPRPHRPTIRHLLLLRRPKHLVTRRHRRCVAGSGVESGVGQPLHHLHHSAGAITTRLIRKTAHGLAVGVEVARGGVGDWEGVRHGPQIIVSDTHHAAGSGIEVFVLT